MDYKYDFQFYVDCADGIHLFVFDPHTKKCVSAGLFYDRYEAGFIYDTYKQLTTNKWYAYFDPQDWSNKRAELLAEELRPQTESDLSTPEILYEAFQQKLTNPDAKRPILVADQTKIYWENIGEYSIAREAFARLKESEQE